MTTTPDDLTDQDIDTVHNYVNTMSGDEMMTYLAYSDSLAEQAWLDHVIALANEQISILIAVAYASARGDLSLQVSIPDQAGSDHHA